MNVIYFIYLFSGILKAILNFHNVYLPIDLTAMTGIIVFGDIIYQLSKFRYGNRLNKRMLTSAGLLFAFFIWMAFTLFYTPSSSYSKLKVFLFSTNILAFLYPVLHSNLDVRKFIRQMILFFLVVSLWFLPIFLYYVKTPELHAVTRFSKFSDLYLVLGLYHGLSILLLVHSNKLFPRMIRLMLIAFFAVCLFLTGARGAIIFTSFIVAVYYLFNLVNDLLIRRLKDKVQIIQNGIIAVFMVILFVVSGIYFADDIERLASRSLTRLNLLVEAEGGGESVNVRYEQIAFSLEKINNDFASIVHGYGVGSYGILESGNDGRAYPHNFVLEIQFELGLIGVLLFCLFLLSVFLSRKQISGAIIPSFIFVYFLLNYFKSWSIVDMRICFGLLGFYFLQRYIKTNEIQKEL